MRMRVRNNAVINMHGVLMSFRELTVTTVWHS